MINSPIWRTTKTHTRPNFEVKLRQTSVEIWESLSEQGFPHHGILDQFADEMYFLEVALIDKLAFSSW